MLNFILKILLLSIISFSLYSEGTYELHGGSLLTTGFQIRNNTVSGQKTTYFRVDILDPTSEVIDIYTEDRNGTNDFEVYCPGTIPVDTNGAAIPTPDYQGNVTATQGRVTNFTQVSQVQTIATRHIPPVTYSLTGATASCGTAGTYIVKVNPSVSQYRYFDIRVRDSSTNTLKTGRVFSYFLNMTVGSFAYGLNYKAYVVAGSDNGTDYDGIVWEIDMNNIKPYVFQMYSNAFGITSYPSQSVHSSLLGNADYVPEYSMYLNPPEKEVIAPLSPGAIAIDLAKSCDTNAQVTGINVDFTVPGSYVYKLYIDENNDGVYSNSEIINAGTSVSGLNSISWNGILPIAGTLIDQNTTYNYQLQITAGEVHFPFRDSEYNIPGPLITKYGGSTTTASQLYYWDDTHPSVSTTGSGTASGPAGSLAEHTWQNNVNGYRDQNVIDTWKYDDLTVSTQADTKACPIEPNPTVLKTSSPSSPVAGQSITYTVTVSNSGTTNAAGVSVIDNLPTGLSNISWTCSATSGSVCNVTSGTGNLNTTADVTTTGSAVYTITADIDSSFSGSLSNSASVSHPDDTDPDDNSSTDTTTVTQVSDIQVSKSHSPVPFVAGDSGSWSIVITNTGPSDATNISVIDTIPVDFQSPTWVCSATGTGSCANTTGSGNISETVDLPEGESATYIVSGTINPASTGNMLNTANVSHPNDDNPNNDSAPDNATIDLDVDLVVTKVHSPMVFVPGMPITYTITVANAGPSNVTGITFLDNLPTAMLTPSWTCSSILGTGSCATTSGTGSVISTTIDLNVNSAVSFAISGTLDPTITSAVANSVTVTHPDDDDPDNNTDTTTANVDPQVDLEISKTHTPTPLVAGSAVTYTVKVKNNGPSFAYASNVIDNMPASLLTPSWTCVVTTGTGTCANATGSGNINELVDLASGSEATYTISATVDSSASGNITNNASVTNDDETDSSDNSASDSDEVIKVADLATIKTSTPDPLIAGGSVVYTITVTNNGPSDVIAASLVDTIPATVQVPTWTCSTTALGSCANASGSGDINETFNLPALGVATYVITGTVNQDFDGTLTNTATSAPPTGTTDPDSSNDSGEDEEEVQRDANIEVSKTHTPVNPVAGENIVWEVNVLNNGPSALNNISVIDNLPSSVINATWTCTVSGIGSCLNASGAGNIGETVDLYSGSIATYTITAEILSSATGNISNTASISHPDDNDPTDNSSIDEFEVTKKADLKLTKTSLPDPFVIGSAVTYTIKVENIGPSDAIGATVTDTLPTDLLTPTWTCSAEVNSSCTASGSGDIADLVNIADGEFVTYTISATIDSSYTGTNLTNIASVTNPSDTTDPDPSNNSDEDESATNKLSDLKVEKIHLQEDVIAGEPITYTITVTNNGPSDLIAGTLIDNMPVSLLTPSWTCTGVDCPILSGTGNINLLFDLPSGNSFELTISATVDPMASGNISNTASVELPEDVTDPNTEDNSSTDDAMIQGDVDISVVKTFSPAMLVRGEAGSFTIRVENAGPSDVTSFNFQDILGSYYLSPTWVCTADVNSSCTANGTGDINDIVTIVAGEFIEYTLNFVLGFESPNPAVNMAELIIPDGFGDEDPGETSDTVNPPVDEDTDNDGIPDSEEGTEDCDCDGIPDLADIDSDGDGLTDLFEAGGIDSDADGVVDNLTDSNFNGIPDAVDPLLGNALPLNNSDSDSMRDFEDYDSDNDGVFDIIEAQDLAAFIYPLGIDSDSDGLDDAFDQDTGGISIMLPVDTDLDTIFDFIDTDSDNDGVPDLVEANDYNFDGNPDVSLTGNDVDMDGVDDGLDPNTTKCSPNGLELNFPVDENGIPMFRIIGNLACAEIGKDIGAIDSAARDISKIGTQALRISKKLGKKGICDPIKNKYLTKNKNKLIDLYHEIWNSVWNFPARNFLGCASDESNCSNLDMIQDKADLKKAFKKLKKLSLKLSKGCVKENTPGYEKKFKKKINKAYKAGIKALGEYPDAVLICGE